LAFLACICVHQGTGRAHKIPLSFLASDFIRNGKITHQKDKYEYKNQNEEMLDQSFSHENFRILLDVENRKGNYLEDKSFFEDNNLFSESRKLSNKIIEINKLIREEKAKLPAKHHRTPDDYNEVNKLEEQKENTKKVRDQKLDEILIKISTTINDDGFKLIIQKGIVKFGDQLYTAENTPENYFVLKQLQRNIYKIFNIKQSDRKKIISQIGLLLKDGFPKVILRTDISKFYESIPHRQLINKIEENSLLSYPSKKVIKDILNQYWKILVDEGVKNANDERIGIPRGIGISAFLSELYLKDLDNLIKSLPDITYFARYVDDIIVIFTPDNRHDVISTASYKSEVKRLIEKFSLKMNNDKTQVIDLRKANYQRRQTKTYNITYLGYKYFITYKKEKNDKGIDIIIRNPLIIRMSDNKFERYKAKIKAVFDQFNLDVIKYSSGVSKSNNKLVQRIKILTSNFRLFRRKDNVLIGIYFSNEFLTDDLQDLKALDKFLKSEIVRVTSNISAIAKNKLDKISFVNGFKNKNTLNLNFNDKNKRGAVNIDKISNVWKDI
jgi:hypothetical protein